MKKLSLYLSSLLAIALIIAGCTKVDDLPFYEKGSAVTLAASSTNVTPTPADSNRQVLGFSWTDPKYATDSTNVKYVLEVDKEGTGFATKRQFTINSVRNFGLTGRQLNNLALAYSNAVGSAVDMEARLVSSYANNNEAYTSNVVKFKLSAFADPSVITASTNSVTLTAAQINNNAVTFNWTRSFPGFNGPITYFLQYDSSGKNFSSLREVRIGADTLTKAFTHGDLNNQALAEGVLGGAQGKLEYRIRAVTALGAVVLSAPFSLTINTYAPATKFFIVGGSTPIGWNPTSALELIKDDRYPGVFYGYSFLDPVGGGFKLLGQRADWSAAGQTIYGDAAGAGNSGNITTTNGGNNIQVSTAGVYRIIVDVPNNKYYLNGAAANGIGGMGLIGSFINWTQPARKMDYIGYNRFNFLVNMNNGDGFKFHDGNDWNNNGAEQHRWFGLSQTANKLGLDPGNFNDIKWNGTSGLTRVVWDATDPNNMRHTHIAGNLYIIGGDAAMGNWDNSTGNASIPAFTHQGNGVWVLNNLTVSSAAQFKLIVEKGNWDILWGNSTNTDLAVGVARAMKFRYYDADPDAFKFPAAGTYNITVNEYTGAITIN